MKIAICAIPAILATVLMTRPFDARDDAVDREDAAGQQENAGDVARAPSGLNPDTEIRLTDHQGPTLAEEPTLAEGPTLAAEPRPEPDLAPQGQPVESAGEWQVVHRRVGDVGRVAGPSRQAVNLDQLARAQEAEREELRRHQAQQLAQFLELQQRQFDQLLEQQEQATAAALAQQQEPEQDLWPAGTQSDQFVEQGNPPEPYQDSGESYGDNRPVPDPYPDDATYQERPVRQRTIDIPLPWRTLRFWLR